MGSAQSKGGAGAVVATAHGPAHATPTTTPPPLLPSAPADAVTWAALHGMVVGLGDPAAPAAALVHAPLAVEPSPLPRRAFQDAVAAAPDFNSLAAAVAADAVWLEATLAPAAAAGDAFTARLLALRRGTARSPADDLALAITRSDYMVDASTGALLQVELNTIASSFGCLGAAASALHAAAAGRAAWPADAAARLPPNTAAASIAAAIAAGADASGVAGGVVLFVVQPGERNAYDQAALAERLWTGHGLAVVRATLAEVAAHSVLGGPDDGRPLEDPAAPAGGRPARPLTYGGRPVAVAYLRAGYSPDDYPTPAEWAGRALLERSTAAVCPTAAWQLAGSKKVQQALAAPGATERFLGGGAAAARVRAHYAGLWSLDPADHGQPGEPASGRAALAALLRSAADRPDRFVLKPQREGGGNNTYGPALAAAASAAAADLEAGGDGGLGAYILMQRIQPAPHASTLVRGGVPTDAPVPCVAELGVFGAWLGRGGGRVAGDAPPPLLNAAAGHLVRTKPAGADEGGVAAGYAVLSSPFLVG